MRARDAPRSSGWIPVAFVGLLLIAGPLAPSPFRTELRFGTFGPDKFLHHAGHAGFTTRGVPTSTTCVPARASDADRPEILDDRSGVVVGLARRRAERKFTIRER